MTSPYASAFMRELTGQPEPTDPEAPPPIQGEASELVFFRWLHPEPTRYYTGDARMPAPPMKMLRPLVRVLAGG